MITKNILYLVFFIGYFNLLQAQEPTEKVSLFKDSTDGAYDISNWLLKKEGFLLIPSIITEPAVGYGAMATAVYFHSSYSEKHGPPSMSGVIGGGTENGTWMVGVFHVGYWKNDRTPVYGAVARTDANIGFYGSGAITDLTGESINLNMDAWILLQQLKGRIGRSNFFVGGKYLLLDTENTFEVPVDEPEFHGAELSSVLSEASLILNYDSRNNVFSPTKGFFIDWSGTYSDDWMGGDGLYGRMGIDLLSYLRATDNLLVSMRIESNYTFGNVPFYARPMVQLRGAPLMKYQNKNTSVFEAEVDWKVYRRWSLIGFTGIGNAYSSLSEFDKGKSVRNYGSGFRYILARKFGAKMGMDFAFTQDDFAFYFVFGTAWLR